MNNTLQGDGNPNLSAFYLFSNVLFIRMNDTPQGDGNFIVCISLTLSTLIIRINDTPQGDGNTICHFFFYKFF